MLTQSSRAKGAFRLYIQDQLKQKVTEFGVEIFFRQIKGYVETQAAKIIHGKKLAIARITYHDKFIDRKNRQALTNLC